MKENLLQKTKIYVSDLLKKDLSEKNYYHNLEHTLRVVTAITELSELENCNEHEIFLLKIAAWFHDTGYIIKDKGHEQESVKIFRDFIKKETMSSEDIKLVESLILATIMGNSPSSNLEKVIKDADCSHLSSPDFIKTSELLRLEIQAKTGEKISKSDWIKTNLNFLAKHQFQTTKAFTNWQVLKENNLKALKQKALKKKKPKKYGKGVETMFRVTLRNHIQLSAIADTKANILLSVNAIIISVALSNLVPKLDSSSNFFLVYPTLILSIFSVASIVLSVLSTLPNISNTNVTKDSIRNNHTNLLFFGNFHKMNLKDFEWGINYLIENEEALYNSLTKDLYYLGIVLKRKYSLLRITYTVFMIGIVISALSFLASYYINVN